MRAIALGKNATGSWVANITVAIAGIHDGSGGRDTLEPGDTVGYRAGAGQKWHSAKIASTGVATYIIGKAYMRSVQYGLDPCRARNQKPSPGSTRSGQKSARPLSPSISTNWRRRRADIGPLPPVVNPPRKEACKNDFGLYCKTYFPHTFTMPWSKDHLRVIKGIESCAMGS